MQDAWRAYLELALGLTEASRKKAREVARELVGRGEATAAQAQSLVDDLISASRTNREGLVRLVRYEVDRALGAVGLATVDEVADLTARLREVERRLNESGTGTGAAESALAGTAAAPKRAAAKKAVVKKAVVKKAAANKAVAKKTVNKKAVAKKTVAKKTVAKKATAKPAGGTAAPAGRGRTRKTTG
ncbi:MAG: hypothetical protein GEV12_19450 [Micromonosporaceae bacterium]|nr:hypothetical protein [Micromonosporaceae bacterium]